MSNQDLTVKEMTQIPADIAEMWGKPPVLRTEDVEAYRKVCLEIAKSVGPADMIEWLWVEDICDLSWEIRRLRGFKVDLLTDGSNINHFIRAYGRIDTVLASVESRRNAVLREIEKRRESVASRLRKASNDVIDGEFTEAESIKEQSADQAALRVADHRPARDAA